jgi:integrase
MDRDGRWETAISDSQKIDKVRRVRGGLGEALSLEEGKLVVYRRGGKFYARIRLSPKKYLWRSLRTRCQDLAMERGRKLFLDVQFKAKYGLAIQSTRFEAALDEYVAMREESHRHGKTSRGMIRQIRRVSRFWREFAGRMLIENIDDHCLNNYLVWRRSYYSRKQTLPKNAKLVPTDKTLQWEMMLGKAILRWAAQRGLRGERPLPTFSFVPKVKRVRPAFEQVEFALLLRVLDARIERACCARYRRSRELLRDYVVLLANSGIRIGEANSLRQADVTPFKDEKGRDNFRLLVKGKTGERDVIPRVAAVPVIVKLLARLPDEQQDALLFQMQGGSAITTLIDQFDAALREANLLHNSRGERFTLYSLRHQYAVTALRNGVGVFELARNMGTSVQIIQSYYGKHATAPTFATRLGD